MPSGFAGSERFSLLIAASNPLRGNEERQGFGDQSGLVRAFDLQGVPRLHDRLSALLRLDAGENNAQADARAGGHWSKKARLVDAVVEAGCRVLGDDADLHGERRDHGEREIPMRDRASVGTFAPGPLDIDVDPLMVAGASGELVDARLINCHPVRNAELLADALAEFGDRERAHSSLLYADGEIARA